MSAREIAVHPWRDHRVVQDGPFDRIHGSVTPNVHAGRQIVADWRSLRVPTVTLAALSARRLAVKNAIAEQNLFSRES